MQTPYNSVTTTLTTIALAATLACTSTSLGSMYVLPQSDLSYKTFSYSNSTMSVPTLSKEEMFPIASMCASLNNRENALNLFGVQSAFTAEERAIYNEILQEESQATGINVFDSY